MLSFKLKCLPAKMALKVENNEGMGVWVIFFHNCTDNPFLENEHLICLHTLECPFLQYGILHNAIARLKA